MAYGTPADPVGGTTATVAYMVANVLDPIRALRAFTGGSDPPGSGYVVTSDSTSTTSWKTMLAAIITAVGGTPAKTSGDTFTGNISTNSNVNFTGDTKGVNFAGGSGIRDNVGAGELQVFANDSKVVVYNEAGSVVLATISNTVAAFLGALSAASASIAGNVGIAGTLNATGTITGGGVINAVTDVQIAGTSVKARSIHTGTQAPATISPQGAGSGLDADNLDGATWFTPVHVDASAGNNSIGTSFATIVGLQHTTTRAGRFLVVIGLQWDFTGSIAALSPQQYRARVRRTGSGTVDSKELYPSVHPGTGYGHLFASVVISAASGDVLSVQATDAGGAGNSNIQGSLAWMDVAWLSP